MKFLIAVVLVLVTGVSVDSRGRIYGGSTADFRQFPFVVKIFTPVSSTLGFSCGGSLISLNYCLTAAHCFDNTGVSIPIVSLALNAYHQFTKNVYAKSVTKHPEYFTNSTTVRNDLALLKIPDVIPSEQMRPISLGGSAYPGQMVGIPGWGLTGIKNQTTTMQVTYLPIMDNDKCNQLLGISYDETQFCTLGSKSSTCSGDSGSPVIIGYGLNAVQCGIVSYGPSPVCAANTPTAYTRLSVFMPWIRKQTGLYNL